MEYPKAYSGKYYKEEGGKLFVSNRAQGEYTEIATLPEQTPGKMEMVEVMKVTMNDGKEYLHYNNVWLSLHQTKEE